MGFEDTKSVPDENPESERIEPTQGGKALVRQSGGLSGEVKTGVPESGEGFTKSVVLTVGPGTMKDLKALLSDLVRTHGVTITSDKGRIVSGQYQYNLEFKGNKGRVESALKVVQDFAKHIEKGIRDNPNAALIDLLMR